MALTRKEQLALQKSRDANRTAEARAARQGRSHKSDNISMEHAKSPRRPESLSGRSNRGFNSCDYDRFYHRVGRKPLPAFEVHNPAVLRDVLLAQFQHYLAYTVIQDLNYNQPWGTFKIYWRGNLVGRTLSYPDWEACRFEHKKDVRLRLRMGDADTNTILAAGEPLPVGEVGITV